MKQFWNGGYVNTLRFFVSIFVQAFPPWQPWGYRQHISHHFFKKSRHEDSGYVAKGIDILLICSRTDVIRLVHGFMWKFLLYWRSRRQQREECAYQCDRNQTDGIQWRRERCTLVRFCPSWSGIDRSTTMASADFSRQALFHGFRNSNYSPRPWDPFG